MHAEYKRDVSGNYLILHSDEPVNTASYQVRMLTGNGIPSVLKCRIQGLDGKTLIYYDITSKQSISSFYEQRKLQGEDLQMIFGGFIKIMEEMAEFLMNHEQLLLCPEYIFIDVEKRNLFFCCLPDYNHPIQEQLRELTEYFLPKLDHEDPAAVSLGYGIYRLAMEPGIQLEAIKEAVYREGNLSKPKSTVKNEEDNMHGNSSDLERINRDILLDDEISDTNKLSESDDLEKIAGLKDKSKPGKWKWLIASILGVFILAGVAIMAYLGYIPNISAQVIIAIAIVVLGLCAGASWIEENKRKKKEETAKWREKVKRELSVESNDKLIFDNDKHEEDHSGSIKQRVDAEIVSSIVSDKIPKEYGETVVLSVGKIKGPASLVSREPGELPTVYLENELTIVGKLENASDTVIPLPTVSRVHARIRCIDNEYYLADLNSRNGTTVNGRMLKPGEEYQLNDEDQVDFAQARYIFLK